MHIYRSRVVMVIWRFHCLGSCSIAIWEILKQLRSLVCDPLMCTLTYALLFCFKLAI